MAFPIVITAITCYLLGNLNGAVCVSALLKDDVRSHGSGNAGLTNFIRNYGTGKALLVVAIDVGKAVIACLAAQFILDRHLDTVTARTIGGIAVMVGHDFPALLGFRGGKGILSGWFIAWMVDWRVGLMIFIVFASAYALSGYVSLGSVLAAVTFAVGFVLLHGDAPIVMAGGIFMSLLTIWMHRENIRRLVSGNERKTNLFKKGSME